ncbi:MAG: ABC transporter substrate-binding protein [Acetobacteraceae bacterium]|nr:ABC transporter substrate-binding protein [Acetobacteraceae bacterium]
MRAGTQSTRRYRNWLAAGLCAGALLAAGAGPAPAQELRMAVGAPVTSIDPHYHNLSPNNALAQEIFEGLFGTDAKARVIPVLAKAWRLVGDDVWEITLKPGVKFHNGNAFTADDVAFTLARAPDVPNSPSSFGIYTRAVKGVEVVDATTVRLRTNGVYPLLPVDLAQVMMLDRETHQNATTEDFNAGRVTFGTGPFRFVRYLPGDRIELERNATYHAEAPAWARVTTRIIVNDPARTAALLAGDVDFIDQVSTSDIGRLRRDQRVLLSEVVGLRIIYLAMDRMRGDGGTPFVTDAQGKPISPNPLNDLRVRKALSGAINREAISQQLMEGASIPAGQFLPAGTFSYVPGLEPPPFDPEGAKKLLAEAGFAHGFNATIHGPNDRYMNDARIIQAIGQYWTRIGINTRVEASPWANFVARASRQEFSIFLVGWGTSTGEASSPLRSLVATYNRDTGMGPSNRGRYSNPEVDRLLAEALRTIDDEAREKLLQDATRIAMQDVGIIPIHIQKNVWAMRTGLSHDARADELTRAQDIRPTR